MQPTAGAKGKSSLPSHGSRVPPPSRPAIIVTPKTKGTTQSQSKEVRKLENLLRAIQATSSVCKDPEGGCFCLARVHKLSSLIPICGACGLVLCDLNLPYYSCPHCLSVILTDHMRESLISSIEKQMSETIAREKSECDRLREDAQKEAGAFPSLRDALGLPGERTGGAMRAVSLDQRHKVMSLDAGTKKVTVASYTSSSSSSNNRSSGERKADKKGRVSAPSAAAVCPVRRELVQSRWADSHSEETIYVR